MFKLFRRKPKTPDEPAVPAEAATVLAMGNQGGIAAVHGVSPPDLSEDEHKPSDSEGAV